MSIPAPDPAGLTSAEALRRLSADGPNELYPPVRRGILGIALEVAREPMFLLLLAAGGLGLVFALPALRSLFRFAVLDQTVTLIGLAATLAGLASFEALKRLWPGRRRSAAGQD